MCQGKEPDALANMIMQDITEDNYSFQETITYSCINDMKMANDKESQILTCSQISDGSYSYTPATLLPCNCEFPLVKYSCSIAIIFSQIALRNLVWKILILFIVILFKLEKNLP